MPKINQREVIDIISGEYCECSPQDIDSTRNNYSTILNNVISNKYYIERFWELDFSKSSPEFRDKNIEFFRKLDEIWYYTLLTNNWEVDYYSLMLVSDWENEYVIPTPVFFDISWINPYDDNWFYDYEIWLQLSYDKFWLIIEWKKEREDIINEEATLDMFESALLSSPSYYIHDWSAWSSESFTRFTIIEQDWSRFKLLESEEISSNYSHSDRIETEYSSAISQILEYLYSNEESNIKSIIYENYSSKHWWQNTDHTHKYFKEFHYNQVKESIFKASLQIVKWVNEEDIISHIAVKHVEELEEKYFEKMNKKFQEVLSRKPQLRLWYWELWHSEYRETIKLIYENWDEIELDFEWEYWSNSSFIETQYYEADITLNQIKKIISQKWYPKEIYFSVKDTNTWQWWLQKDDFDEFVFGLEKVKNLGLI